jgi:hypothetical protein
VSATLLDLADPQLPGLATIGDETALRAVLSAVGEELVERGYLRYKPGTSLVAALRLGSGPAFAYAVSAAARPKLDKLVDRAPEGSLICSAPAEGLLIARAAADRDLPALARADRLAALLPAAAQPEGWQTLAYKPQRRWVGRPTGTPVGCGHLLRAYRPMDLARMLPSWRLAACVAERARGVRLPEVRSSSSRYGVAAVSWLPGEPLDRLLAADAAPVGALREVGAGLARVHDTLVRRAVGRPATTALRAAERVLRELGAVLPEHRGRAAGLVRRLTSGAPETAWTHPVHGDFSTDQVILGSDGAVGFADWDRAGWGDPAADLGSLRAAGLPDPAYSEVLQGYADVRALPTGIDWYVAVAGLVRLTEPFRTCQNHWRTEITDRLAGLERQVDALDHPGTPERLRS